MKYRKARNADLVEIQGLLKGFKLPANDLLEHIENFYVAENTSGIVGVGGYEEYGDIGLVRSFAVHSSYQGERVAENIFDLVKESALRKNIRELYLLTTSAEEYFHCLGFCAIQREEAPLKIKKSKQFNELCPTSAVIMSLILGKDCGSHNKGQQRTIKSVI